ncbi:MAG TPA: preprotein translocase subunit SecG [Rectinemataceae bacterium]|nr:preprotein translocase subunit SecG [Rectinemataceae bacterium]
MGILSIFLLIIFVIVSLLLVFMVVIQNEAADGLGGIFAGSSNTAFGSRSSNVMQRFTYVLGALFFVCAFSLALLDKGSTGNVEAAALKNAPAQTSSSEWWKNTGTQAAPAPAGTAPATPQPSTAPAPAIPSPPASGSGN